jgi:hypothetical protein
MLRQTVSQSVCRGVKFTLELVTRYYILSESCCVVSVGRPLWREVESVSCQSLSSCLVYCQRFNIIYIVHVTCFKYMYNILDFSQQRLSTADHAKIYAFIHSWHICEYIFPLTHVLLFATAATLGVCFMCSATPKEHNTGGYRSTLHYKFDYGCLATRLGMKMLSLVNESVGNYAGCCGCPNRTVLCRIWGSQNGSYERFHLLAYIAV